MSYQEAPSKLNSTINLRHTNFLTRMDSLLQGLKEFKTSYDEYFTDITQQCLDLEDRFDDVRIQKEVILTRYQCLKRKEKEGCKTCLALEKQLGIKSGIIKQYEVKLKNIANLLYVNTVNTEANQKQLMSNIMNTEQAQSQNSPCHDRKKDKDCVDEKEEELEENVLPENSQRKNKIEQGSKILVHENEDEEYFETTIRRKTPENAETVMEIPETFCEDFTSYDHPRKIPLEKSPDVSYETPSKKRKFAELSPSKNVDNAVASQRSPKLNRAENQTGSPPPLSPKTKTVAAMKERNIVSLTKANAAVLCNSPSLITKAKLKSTDLLCNSPSLITKPKLRSQGKSQETEGNIMKETHEVGKVRKDSNDARDKEHRNLPTRVSEDEEDGEDIHEQDKENSENDETRFPLLEPMDKDEDDNNSDSKENNTRDSKENNTSSSPKSGKQSTSQSKEKKMNASKVWENIEFSDDDDDDSDDFVDKTRKSKQQASSRNSHETNEKSKQTSSNCDETSKKSKQTSSNNKEEQNASFAFAKPADADTSKSKWKLKLAGGGSSSVNKSTRLKQTKLSMEKKVGKVDITQVEGYNGGVTPSGNSQKGKESSETGREKRLIIEETQLQSEEESDTDIEAERKDLANKQDCGNLKKAKQQTTNKQTCGNESTDSNSSDTERRIRVRPLSQLTDESMLFQPNAVSTQKTKSQLKNTNTTKQAISTRQCDKMNTSPARRTTRQSPNKNEGTSGCNEEPSSSNKGTSRCTTPKSETRTGSRVRSNTKSGNSGTDAASTSNMGRSNVRKPLFLPKEAKESKKEDFTSKWTCPECIDYYVDGYGAGILKIRPPPKKCGHNGKYPATPPDFWDPMCS
uniref:Uncharacterized protein n=1 Tax=Cacopsylla melanoneura TaxID=428564 RepID=A0A8D8Q3P3_9HEMI